MTPPPRAKAFVGTHLVVLLLAAAILPQAIAIEETTNLIRGIVHHIQVHPGSSIAATYRTGCLDYQCAAFLWVTNPGAGSYSTLDDLGNLTYSLTTPIGSLYAPIFEEEPTEGWNRVYGVNHQYEEDTVVRIGFLTTHGLTYDLSLTNAELISTSETEHVNRYRISDFPGVSSRVIWPGVTSTQLDWHAEKGAFGFYLNGIGVFEGPTFGYTRIGPSAISQCPLGAPFLGCRDVFFDGPGDYQMNIVAAANALDSYVAAWADLET